MLYTTATASSSAFNFTFVNGNNTLPTNPGDSVKIKKAKASQIAYLEQLNNLRKKGTSLEQPLVNAITTALEDEEVLKNTRSFPSLDNKIRKKNTFNVSLANTSPEFTPEFIKANFEANPKVDTLLNQAKTAMNALKELGNFVDILTGKELLELPVGLRKKDSTSGNTVELAIVEVQFTPQYAEFKAWGKLTIPEEGENGEAERELYFGAEGIKMSHDGALLGDMKLVLLGDQAIPINGENWLLTLKGGINLKTGDFSDQSYIEFDCSGLKSIGLEGDLRVSRKVLLPIDDDGEYVCTVDNTTSDPDFENKETEKLIDNKCYVGTSFSIQANGWNDLLIETSLPKFEVVGLKGWGFNVENAVLDLSDSRSSDNFQLPEAYANLYNASNLKLWRGFYAKEISVMLPKGIENNKTTSKRVTFGAENLIIDSQGVSGKFFAENVLQTGDGSAGKWAFTIDDVSISLAMNTIVGGSIGGDIAVPILDEPMDYEGYISAEGYGLEVGLQSNYKSGVFLGEMQLEKNSSIAINVKDGNVYPYANLTGQLAIAGKINQKEEDSATTEATTQANTNATGTETATTATTTTNPTPTTVTDSTATDSKGFAFNGISFQELELQTEPGTQPIQAKYFGFEGEMNLMGFPASISNLALVTPENQVGLSFDLKINLDGDGSFATTSLGVFGDLEEGDEIQNWKFKEVKLSGIKIDFEKSGLHLMGSLDVLEDDPTYGNAIAGDLTIDITKLKYEVGAKAMFGSKDFRYWFVDIWSTENEGSSGKLLINSFAGGVSSHMKRSSATTADFNPSKTVYVPDADTGLGLRAGVGIGSTNGNAFNAKVFLEMEFNTNGGLNRIGFTGQGAMMSDDSTYASPVDELTTNSQMMTKINDFVEDNADRAKSFIEDNDFLGLSKSAIPQNEVAKSGSVGVFVGIEKDFVNDSFHGEFEVYLDLEGIKGGNPDNLAGRAVIHTSPTEWYIHIGTPETPISLTFDMKLTEVNVQGYFMTGTKLPSAVPPRAEVTRILGDDVADLNRTGKDGTLEAAKGFAFGLNFSYQYNYEFLIFYAYVKFGGGFDIMHAYYPDAKCVGRPGPVGNDGWYSMGQVYAFIEGEFGVDVNLLFVKGKFPIAYAGVAALLRGQFPNPLYLKGYIGMRYEILGGLVSGNMRMKFEAGEECEFEGISSSVGVPIISDIEPADSDTDVSVYAAPQAVFTYAVEQPVNIQQDEGQRTFKIQLKQFNLEANGQQLEGELEWNDTHDAVTFKSNEILPSETDVKATVEVSFDERINGVYQTLIEDGNPVVETKEITFKTGTAPDHIPWEQISFMYPLPEQQNFYPQEYPTGYIKTKQPHAYLFESGFEMRAEFVSKLTNEGVRADLRYDSSNDMIFFDIPELITESEYQLDLMIYPPGQDTPAEIFVQQETTVYDDADATSEDTNWYNPTTGTQSVEDNVTSSTTEVALKQASGLQLNNATPKSILDYTFRTSKHETFEDKIDDLVITDNLTNPIFYYENDELNVKSKVHSLSIKVANYESLEEYEILGGEYTPNALVYPEAVLNDSYYRDSIGPMMYDTSIDNRIYPINNDIYVDRDESVLGVPPVKSFLLAYEYLRDYKDNPESPWVKNRIPFIYNLSYQYQEDFIYLRHRLYSRYPNPTEAIDIYRKYNLLLNNVFPAFKLGTYNAKLIYRTPGDIYTNSYNINYIND
jgi:hypothetical protein